MVDEFTGRALDAAWQWPWDQPEPPSVEPGRGGWLRLRTGTASHAVAARPTLAGSYVATAVLDAASITAGARAGVAAFGNRDNLLAITVERPEGAGEPQTPDVLRVVVWRTQKGERATLATDTVESRGTVHLQLKATDRTRFQFAVSGDGRNWNTLASDAEGSYLPPWDLAVRAALLVAGRDASATFGAFRLESVTH